MQKINNIKKSLTLASAILYSATGSLGILYSKIVFVCMFTDMLRVDKSYRTLLRFLPLCCRNPAG